MYLLPCTGSFARWCRAWWMFISTNPVVVGSPWLICGAELFFLVAQHIWSYLYYWVRWFSWLSWVLSSTIPGCDWWAVSLCWLTNTTYSPCPNTSHGPRRVLSLSAAFDPGSFPPWPTSHCLLLPSRHPVFKLWEIQAVSNPGLTLASATICKQSHYASGYPGIFPPGWAPCYLWLQSVG